MNESTSGSCPDVPPENSWRRVDARRTPVVSLLLPAGEHDRDLGARLSAALGQTMRAHEILVLDTSPDGRHFATFSAWADRPGGPLLRYLRLPGADARQARAAGGRVAAGNIRLVVAPGLEPATSWLEQLVTRVRRWLAASGAAAVHSLGRTRGAGASLAAG
ncbi:hypothetical protein ACTU3I_12765 [Microbacterium sp. RD1]|uniref:hypothetical protein n=1 Tax=Microbacterium sp. RD1 TaxID=3457313 RepID=UPI003FA53BFB